MYQLLDLQRQKFMFVNFFCRHKNIWRPAAAADLKRHGFSIHSWNSSGLLAPHCSSNSRRALSDSCHLHVIPHIRLFTQGYFFSLFIFQMQLSQAEMRRSMQHALFSHLNIRLSFYISRWLFLVISSYLILRSRRVVNDPIRYSYCAEFGIFVCRGWLSFVWLQHQGQQFCWIILLALYGTLIFLQW